MRLLLLVVWHLRTHNDGVLRLCACLPVAGFICPSRDRRILLTHHQRSSTNFTVALKLFFTIPLLESATSGIGVLTSSLTAVSFSLDAESLAAATVTLLEQHPKEEGFVIDYFKSYIVGGCREMTRTAISLFLLMSHVMSRKIAFGFLFSYSRKILSSGGSLPLASKLFGIEEFDDEIGVDGVDKSKNLEGESLAKDFYKQLRKRELNRELPSIYSDKVTQPLFSEEQMKLESRKSLEGQGDIPDGATPKLKFAGRQTEPSNIGTSSSSGSQQKTQRDQMIEREFNLVGRAEQGIRLQAVALGAALCFYIYVGLTGGIVSGNEAAMQDFGGDDEIPVERLLPIPTDREASVWL